MALRTIRPKGLRRRTLTPRRDTSPAEEISAARPVPHPGEDPGHLPGDLTAIAEVPDLDTPLVEAMSGAVAAAVADVLGASRPVPHRQVGEIVVASGETTADVYLQRVAVAMVFQVNHVALELTGAGTVVLFLDTSGVPLQRIATVVIAGTVGEWAPPAGFWLGAGQRIVAAGSSLAATEVLRAIAWGVLRRA